MSKTALPTDPEGTVERVREEYARIADRRGRQTTVCSSRIGYQSNEIDSLPTAAVLGLGCGAPVSRLALQAGETVLDLGSGGGIDVFLAARQVGPTGRVIGVDMTREMIELARENARSDGYDNVDFRLGRLERLPVEDATIDAVTSNCVINLVPDKRNVFAEIARVLRPGGRLVISDIVLERPLPTTLIRELSSDTCVPTAMLRQEYVALIRETGLGEPEILRDVDYLAAVGWADSDGVNEESRALLERAGVDYREIEGSVRSITFRATRAG